MVVVVVEEIVKDDVTGTMINGRGGEKGVIRSNVVPVINKGETKHKATAIYLPCKGLKLPGDYKFKPELLSRITIKALP